jgi:hypothetical protein
MWVVPRALELHKEEHREELKAFAVHYTRTWLERNP